MATRGRITQLGIISLVIILLLGGVSTYAARDNLIRYTLKPNHDFDEKPVPAAPDYNQTASWGVIERRADHHADVFFIYPTIYFSGEHWNAPFNNPAVRERLVSVIKPLYAAPFAASANLYAPMYRQAAPYSFMGGGESGRDARGIAFRDVAAAFEKFLSQHNKGRPFIIAGYGQGALYGIRLIAELDPEVRSRLIAAYLLEIAVPVDVIQSMTKATPLCDTPDQTGCLVIWHSTTQNARGDLPRQNALIWKPGGGLDATRGRELACVNPLTWSVSGRAGSPEMNLGAAELSEFGTGDTTITRAATSADCWNGLLFTDVTPVPIFFWAGPRYRELFPSTVNPFYADLMDNVARRIESNAAQASLPEPPPDTGELREATPAPSSP